MSKHRLVLAVAVAAVLVCAETPAHAQYVEPGPSGGGSCRPATPEVETDAGATPVAQGWRWWIATLRRPIEWRATPRWAARSLGPALTRPAVVAVRRRSAR
jgi:hypothetical protein